MPSQVRVAALSELPPGSSKEVAAEGKVIALFNVEGALYALDGVCPHAGGPLAEGAVACGANGPILTCPWHGWQFHLPGGTNCLNPRIVQTAYPVTVQGDEILVEMP